VLWALDRLTFRYSLANSTANQTQTISQSLQNVALLQDLTEDQVSRIADAVEVFHYDPGTAIIEKGTEGNVMYMIQSGSQFIYFV